MSSRAALRFLVALCGVFALGVIAAGCATPELPQAVSIAGPEVVPATATPTATPMPPTATPVPTIADPASLALPPTATPVPVPGLTETTMRIGVIADLETSDVADNLSLGAWEAMNAWAATVNANGGIAGRTVELVLADAQVFFHWEAAVWVCSNDIFAIVGSKAIDDGNGVAELSSNACGIPDFPAVAFMSERRDSPVTTVSNPFPSPFYQAGPLRWLGEEFPEAATESSTIILGFPSIRVETELMREAATEAGFQFVYDPLVAPNEDFLLHAQAMEEEEVESLVWTGNPEALVELLGTRTFSSAPPLKFVLCGPDCYSESFARENAGLTEGVSAWIPHLPFSEPSDAPEIVNYLYSLIGAVPNSMPSSQGVAAWASGRLFEEAASRAVGAGTPSYDESALTRESLLAAAGTIDAWTANGIYGVGGAAPNPAGGIPSPCFVLMRVEEGTWVRQHPLEPGTMDCSTSNRVALSSGAGVGLVETAGSATPLQTAEDVPQESVATDPLEVDEPDE